MKYFYILLPIIFITAVVVGYRTETNKKITENTPAYNVLNPELKNYVILDGLFDISVPVNWVFKQNATSMYFEDTNILYSKDSSLDLSANEMQIELRDDPDYLSYYNDLEDGRSIISDTTYFTTGEKIGNFDVKKVEFDAKNVSRGIIYFIPLSSGDRKAILTLSGFTRENSDEWIRQSEQAIKTINIDLSKLESLIK
jgi:hypothetical protein